MRVLYLGSPTFAVPPLEALAQAGYELVGVVTQPDRPAGRKRTPTAPPVKIAAQQLDVPVLQPETLRSTEVVAQIAALQPAVGIVAAYGEILRPAVLAIPPLGYLNIHPSLLPLHRGPAPVAGAILAGDTETGVSIMRLDSGMDSGPILVQTRVPLPETARTGPLTEELFRLGTRLLLDTLPRYAAGEIKLQEQDSSQATCTRLLQKSDGLIDWSLPAHEIERRTRAFDPWPGTFTTWHGQPFKVPEVVVAPEQAGDAAPGTILPAARGADAALLVATGSGVLELHTVQPAGKRPMSGHAWLLGQAIGVVGQQFGS